MNAEPTQQTHGEGCYLLGKRAKLATRKSAGVMMTACTQEEDRSNTGSFITRSGVEDQPDAREGQAGRGGVTERLVVLMKPGNAGGRKGPQFKTKRKK